MYTAQALLVILAGHLTAAAVLRRDVDIVTAVDVVTDYNVVTIWAPETIVSSSTSLAPVQIWPSFSPPSPPATKHSATSTHSLFQFWHTHGPLPFDKPSTTSHHKSSSTTPSEQSSSPTTSSERSSSPVQAPPTTTSSSTYQDLIMPTALTGFGAPRTLHI